MESNSRVRFGVTVALGLLVVAVIGFWAPTGERDEAPRAPPSRIEAQVATGQPISAESEAQPEPPAPEEAEREPAQDPTAAAFLLRAAAPAVQPGTIRVVDDDGNPVAGAVVMSGRRGTTDTIHAATDARGEVTVSLNTGERALLRVISGKFVAAVETPWPNPVGTTVEMRLSPALALSGRVLDPAGQGVVGARVEVMLHMPPQVVFPVAVTSGPDGSFVVPDLPLARMGKSVQVTASAIGQVPASVTVRRPEFAGGSVVINMAPPQRVTGRVVDERGRPVVGARLTVRGAGPLRTRWARDGMFSLGPLPAAARFVYVNSHKHALAAVRLPGAGASTAALGTVVLRAGSPLRGRVVTEDGEPVGGARLYLRSEDDRDAPAADATADERGQFSFDHAGDDLYSVVCVGGPTVGGRPFRLSGGTEGVRAGQQGIRVVLRSSAIVTLALVDAATSRPLQATRVSVGVSASGGKHLFTTSFSGGVRVSMPVTLPGGETYDLRVEVPDRDPVVIRDLALRAGEDVELEVRFDRR